MTTAVSLANAEDEVYWLALRMVPGLGDKKAVPLVKSYRSPHAVFRASASELMAAGLSGATAHSIASGCTFDDAAEQSRLLRKSGAVLVPCLGSAYPESLQSLYDPPLLLFCLGDTALLRSVMVGVVGTRRPSPYGTAAADRLSADLALAGATVVSGMARGSTPPRTGPLSKPEAQRLRCSDPASITSIPPRTADSPPRSQPGEC